MACTSNEIRQELRTEFEVKIFPLHAHEQEVPLPRDGAGGGGEGYSQKSWVGACGPLPKPLTLFMTKIGHISLPIRDVTKNLIPFYDLTIKSKPLSDLSIIVKSLELSDQC